MARPKRVQQAEVEDVADLIETPVPESMVIPMWACPPELSYLAEGHTVGLKVLGRLTPSGVQVEGIVLLR